MKTIVTIEVEHDRPIPEIANMVAGRAWSINGVRRAEVVPAEIVEVCVIDLSAAGFTRDEIALGRSEVVRG